MPENIAVNFQPERLQLKKAIDWMGDIVDAALNKGGIDPDLLAGLMGAIIILEEHLEAEEEVGRDGILPKPAPVHPALSPEPQTSRINPERRSDLGT